MVNAIAVVALVALAAGGHGQPGTAAQSGTPADRQAISQIRNQEIASFSSGDVEQLLSLCTDDLVLMPPNEPTLVGKDAVRAWARAMYQEFKIQGSYTSTADLRVVGDWAFERMSFKLTLTPVGGGAAMEDVGKGFHVYRREGGAWKIALDIWNSDTPVAVAR